MSDVAEKMRDLLAASREVIADCALGNGAIVAANTDKNYAAKGTSDYRFVWPRDAAFMIYAGQLLHLPLGGPFSHWLHERAEAFESRGLFCRRYATHGPCSSPVAEYQPDQAGTLLWALTAAPVADHSAEVEAVIATTATSLCRSWDTDHFTEATYDLWEQFLNTETRGSFVYSLAACSYGLRAASQRNQAEQARWQQVAQEMQRQLLTFGEQPFTRLSNQADDRLDASLLGLVWPFRCTDNVIGLRKTVVQLREALWRHGGLLRFNGDVYDGVTKESEDLMGGAGPWPLLTFWYAIALHELGETAPARLVFERAVATLPNRWIPEQILTEGRQGVTPLGWGHAMFVIAYHRLGYAQ